MTELRNRMIEILQLRGLSERTQQAYVRAVGQLAAHYDKSPAVVGPIFRHRTIICKAADLDSSRESEEESEDVHEETNLNQKKNLIQEKSLSTRKN